MSCRWKGSIGRGAEEWMYKWLEAPSWYLQRYYYWDGFLGRARVGRGVFVAEQDTHLRNTPALLEFLLFIYKCAEFFDIMRSSMWLIQWQEKHTLMDVLEVRRTCSCLFFCPSSFPLLPSSSWSLVGFYVPFCLPGLLFEFSCHKIVKFSKILRKHRDAERETEREKERKKKKERIREQKMEKFVANCLLVLGLTRT